jgi:hypothetical protein
MAAVLLVLGAILVSVGAGLINLPAGFIVAGVILLFAAVDLSRP